MESLFNIELYYTQKIIFADNIFYLLEDELHHAVKVMRSEKGDKIFATDGKGNIYEGIILEINKEFLSASISKKYNYQNQYQNINLYIPNLKNPDRLRFAIEKSVELGITNFFIFNSDRAIKKPVNLGRIEKILISAMKQSLRAFLPKAEFMESVRLLKKEKGVYIVFDQKSDMRFIDYNFEKNKNYYLFFGPEGSLTDDEIQLINPDMIFSLGHHRLRSETAIIKAVSIISGY